MFDVDYVVEASIAAAEIEIEKTWSKIMHLDLAKTWGLAEMFYITDLKEIKKYWSIMYGTHGG